MQPRPLSTASSAAGQRALGVLAGRDMPLALLQSWAETADVVFAADAGLDRLLQAGFEPDVVIGDFDSSTAIGNFKGQILHDPSADATDTDKLLALAASQGLEQITLASVEGDQLDHMIATLHSALKSPLRVRVALRTGVGWLLRGGEERAVQTMPGRRVSLLPLEEVRGVTLAGVRWSLERADLHPLGQSSISNEATESVVTASSESGSAFLFVSYPEEEMPVWSL